MTDSDIGHVRRSLFPKMDSCGEGSSQRCSYETLSFTAYRVQFSRCPDSWALSHRRHFLHEDGLENVSSFFTDCWLQARCRGIVRFDILHCHSRECFQDQVLSAFVCRRNARPYRLKDGSAMSTAGPGFHLTIRQRIEQRCRVATRQEGVRSLSEPRSVYPPTK
jgi:hypothetical protein